MGKLFNAVSFKYSFGSTRVITDFEGMVSSSTKFSLVDTSLNLNNGSYTNVNYGLDFNRRAYSIGAFYNSSNESLGIRFNIFNFDYSGLSEKF